MYAHRIILSVPGFAQGFDNCPFRGSVNTVLTNAPLPRAIMNDAGKNDVYPNDQGRTITIVNDL